MTESREPAWRWWIGQMVPAALLLLAGGFGLYVNHALLRQQFDDQTATQEKNLVRLQDDFTASLARIQSEAASNLKAVTDSTNARFEAISLRIGNQDVLINNITTMTTRLDERLKGMMDNGAALTARRDEQWKAIEEVLELIRSEQATGRERDARLETKLDALIETKKSNL